MGKGLIGNSLSSCISDILVGKISIEDVGTIYAGTCFTEETIPDMLKGYKYTWEMAAGEIARNEVFKKYGVKKWLELDESVRDAADAEIDSREAELIPSVKKQAADVFYQLYESGKIVQTRYRLPEGEKAQVRYVDFDGKIGEPYEVTSKDGELMQIDGVLYKSYENCVYSNNTHRWCNNIEEFIISQLESSPDTWGRYAKSPMLKLLFPQYAQAIDKLCEIKAERCENGEYFIPFEELVGIFGELTQTKVEHTAEGIGEAVGATVRKEAMTEALANMTDEPQVDKNQIQHTED